MKKYDLFIALPPTDNQIYRGKTSGKKFFVYKNPAYVAWQKEAFFKLREQGIPRRLMKETHWGFYGICFIPKGLHYRVDLPNFAKAFFDLLKTYIEVDDNKVVDFRMLKFLSKESARGSIQGKLVLWSSYADFEPTLHNMIHALIGKMEFSAQLTALEA